MFSTARIVAALRQIEFKKGLLSSLCKHSNKLSLVVPQILALIGLRNKEAIVDANRQLILQNLHLATQFFGR